MTHMFNWNFWSKSKEESKFPDFKLLPLEPSELLKLQINPDHQQYTLNHDRTGTLSLHAPVNISPQAKLKAKLPPGAAHFAWAYPCARLYPSDTPGLEALCRNGAFLYFDAKKDLVGVTAVCDEPGEDLAFQKERDFPDLLKVLALAKERRFCRASERLRAAGYAEYCWLAPHETDSLASSISDNGAFLLASRTAATLLAVKDTSQVVWQWHLQGRLWVTYDLTANRRLEETYGAGCVEVTLESPAMLHGPYVVNFVRKVQRSVKNGKERRIRRSFVGDTLDFRWQFYHDKVFSDYDKNSTKELESGFVSALAGGSNSVCIGPAGVPHQYVVRFSDMRQINQKSNFTRVLRRLVFVREREGGQVEMAKRLPRLETNNVYSGQVRVCILGASFIGSEYKHCFVSVTTDFSEFSQATGAVSGPNPQWNWGCVVEFKGRSTKGEIVFNLYHVVEKREVYLGYVGFRMGEVIEGKFAGKRKVKLEFENKKARNGAEDIEIEFSLEYIPAPKELILTDLLPDLKVPLGIKKIDKNLIEGFEGKYELGRKIGEGTGGIVKIGIKKDMNFKTEYAIKIITKQSTLDMEDKLKRELTIMNKIKQNSYCVSLRDISQSEYHIYIVMEYCQIGDLFQFKQKYPSLTESKQFIKDILCAIEYLHGQNIVHRDIKPENIFVSRSSTNKEYSFKLGDFGEAECLQDNRVSTLRGTPQFMAPELLLSEGKPVAAKETDLWSFGGTVYTYFTDTLLWQVQEGQDSYLEGLKKAVQKAHGVVDCSDITSPTLVDFLQRMLQVEPSNRATPQELQQHPFLSDQEVITEEEEDLGI